MFHGAAPVMSASELRPGESVVEVAQLTVEDVGVGVLTLVLQEQIGVAGRWSAP